MSIIQVVFFNWHKIILTSLNKSCLFLLNFVHWIFICGEYKAVNFMKKTFKHNEIKETVSVEVD